MAKILVVVIFIGIVASLASGLFYLGKDRGQSDRTVKALTLRIGVSVALFGLLMLMWWLGVIEPQGSPMRTG